MDLVVLKTNLLMLISYLYSYVSVRSCSVYYNYPRPNTSIKNKEHAVFTYLLKGLVLTKPHQVWQVDITYLRTTKGFMYLSHNNRYVQ